MKLFCTYLWTANGAGWFVLGIIAESPEAMVVCAGSIGAALLCDWAFD